LDLGENEIVVAEKNEFAGRAAYCNADRNSKSNRVNLLPCLKRFPLAIRKKSSLVLHSTVPGGTVVEEWLAS
jgi:hypothetical protein